MLSCKKQIENSISLTGKIIDAQTLLPVPNYSLTLNFIDGNSRWGGFNLGSYSKIANCVTNLNGEYILTTNRTYAKDSLDNYEIESLRNDNYFGCSEKINAQNADVVKNNSIATIKIYKKIFVNFYVHHLGVANSNDNIFIDINGVFNYRNSFYFGSDSLQQDNLEIVPNSPTIIIWKGIKNNIRFGPFTDTVIFSNINNSYNIFY